ncbi:MAG TPA: prolipoprotein diacylglyceryl transferase family protein [Coriobacteriia bacterium]|nr:prolipoprotein diacylglyceryl transferase family protein [Coriobacteriia bacterium]
MHPVLIEATIAGMHVQVQSYTAALVVGAFAGLVLALCLALWRGLPVGRSAAVLVTAVAVAPLGGRALHVLTSPQAYVSDPAQVFEPSLTAMALFGAVSAAIVAAVVAAALLRVDVWRLGDAAAPGIMLGIACAKIGCLAAGCCHGVVTHGPFGVVYGLGSPAHGLQMLTGMAGLLGPVLPVFANQPMEAGAALALGLVALLLPRRASSGAALLVSAAGFAAVRLALHPLRWEAPGFAGATRVYQVIYVGVIIVCAAVWAVRRVGARPHGSEAIRRA